MFWQQKRELKVCLTGNGYPLVILVNQGVLKNSKQLNFQRVFFTISFSSPRKESVTIWVKVDE